MSVNFVADVQVVVARFGSYATRQSVVWPARPDAAGTRWPPSGFLGELEATEEADQRGRRRSSLRVEDLVEVRYQYVSAGRTSIAPPYLTAGVPAASSSTASRSSASTTKYAPIASLIPMYGPSVMSVLPSSARTVVALSGSPTGVPAVTPSVLPSAW